MSGYPGKSERFPLAGAFGLYTIAFLALGWPWLSGAVEIPYDAASQFYPQLAFLPIPFAFLVALSRMVVGLHYPSDVLAGAAIGAAIAGISLVL